MTCVSSVLEYYEVLSLERLCVYLVIVMVEVQEASSCSRRVCQQGRGLRKWAKDYSKSLDLYSDEVRIRIQVVESQFLAFYPLFFAVSKSYW